MTMSAGVRVSQSEAWPAGTDAVAHPAVDPVGHALVRLEVAQAPAEEVLVHKRIVDQLGKHEDAAAGILRQGLVGPLDRVLDPQAEAEMARDDVAHRAEVEGDGRRRGALMAPGQGLDRGAELRLVEGVGGRVLGVDGGVALLFRAELVDEVVLAQVQVGDRHQVRLEPCEHGREVGGEAPRRGLQALDRLEVDGGIGRRALDLGKKDPQAAPSGFRGKVFDRRGVRRKYGGQASDRLREIAAGKDQLGLGRPAPDGELVAGAERQHGEVTVAGLIQSMNEISRRRRIWRAPEKCEACAKSLPNFRWPRFVGVWRQAGFSRIESEARPIFVSTPIPRHRWLRRQTPASAGNNHYV